MNDLLSHIIVWGVFFFLWIWPLDDNVREKGGLKTHQMHFILSLLVARWFGAMCYGAHRSERSRGACSDRRPTVHIRPPHLLSLMRGGGFELVVFEHAPPTIMELPLTQNPPTQNLLPPPPPRVDHLPPLLTTLISCQHLSSTHSSLCPSHPLFLMPLITTFHVYPTPPHVTSPFYLPHSLHDTCLPCRFHLCHCCPHCAPTTAASLLPPCHFPMPHHPTMFISLSTTSSHRHFVVLWRYRIVLCIYAISTDGAEIVSDREDISVKLYA
jgi:hypothetical protein